MTARGLSWVGLLRLGLVQMTIGSIVVLPTSTFNRVIAVELGLWATLPGVLVALHYLVQISRPRFGHGSDTGGRRTPWIIGGIAVLGASTVLGALSIAVMQHQLALGVALAVLAYIGIGAGVGAAGTSLLVLLANLVAPQRKAAAATLTWTLMILGIVITAGAAGALLDPFSLGRLTAVTAGVAIVALLIATLAIAGIERNNPRVGSPQPDNTAASASFVTAVREVLGEAQTRRFALFVFLSMLAYSAQDLILEPYAGAVFGMSPKESTQLGGFQHIGVLMGMLFVGIVGGRMAQAVRGCMVAGCVGAAAMLALLAAGGQWPDSWPLVVNVVALGAATGTFAVAAIGSMMHLVSEGHSGRDGVRMGVWGAAQAIAFGTGSVLGTLLVDVTRALTGDTALAYGLVFALQATLFLVAAVMAAQLSRDRAPANPDTLTPLLKGSVHG